MSSNNFLLVKVVIIVLRHSSQAAILIKISNLLHLSCPIHEKDNFIKVCVLYCVVLLNSVLF